MDIRRLGMKFFKKSVLYTWTLFFLLLLIVSISASWFIYQKAISALGGETEQSYKLELNRLKYLFDKELVEMKRIALEMSLNEDLQQLIQMESVSAQSRVEMMLLQKRLKVYCISNASIEDIVIGFNDVDMAVSNRSIYTIEQVSDILLDGNLLPELEKRTYKSKFILVNKRHQAGTFQPTIVYLQSLPLVSGSKNNAFVMIRLYSDSLLELLPAAEGKMLSISDESSTVLLSNNGITDPATAQIDSDAFRIYLSKSETSGMTYRYCIANRVFFDKISNINTFTQISLISCVILFISGLVVFLRLNYNPIHRIFMKINEQANEKATRTKNELSFIEGSLYHMLKERQSMIGTLDKQTFALKKYFLLRLLKGEVEELSEAEYTPVSSLYFDCKGFFVVLARPRNLFSRMEEIGDLIAHQKLVFYTIKKVFDEMTPDSVCVDSLEVDDSMVILLGHRTLCDEGSEIKTVELLQKASCSLKNLFDLEVILSGSQRVASLADISMAYKQAQETAEYCQLFEKNMAVYTRNSAEVDRVEKKHRLLCNKKFGNCISTGEFADASAMIDEIFDSYFHEEGTVSITRIHMNLLIHVIYSALADFSAAFYKQLDIDNILYPLFECKSLQAFKAAIVSALNATAQEYRQQQEEGKVQRFDEIEKYIEASFMDQDLSVGKIADVFDMSMPYLSKAFKKHTSMGLLEYIHVIRIKEAKKLLESKKYNINEIASMVGFIDSSSFIKVFKRLEGIPPGKYTKMKS